MMQSSLRFHVVLFWKFRQKPEIFVYIYSEKKVLEN